MRCGNCTTKTRADGCDATRSSGCWARTWSGKRGPVDLFPWAGTHRGHDGVRRWFELLDAAMAYERFELVELYADGETVVEVIAAAGKARATGTPFASEVVRIWTFRNGKAVRVRSYYDTHVYAAALTGT